MQEMQKKHAASNNEPWSSLVWSFWSIWSTGAFKLPPEYLTTHQRAMDSTLLLTQHHAYEVMRDQTTKRLLCIRKYKGAALTSRLSQMPMVRSNVATSSILALMTDVRLPQSSGAFSYDILKYNYTTTARDFMHAVTARAGHMVNDAYQSHRLEVAASILPEELRFFTNTDGHHCVAYHDSGDGLAFPRWAAFYGIEHMVQRFEGAVDVLSSFLPCGIPLYHKHIFLITL